MNSRELKSVMVLNGDNVVSLANFLGISEQSLRNKMRENGTSFKQGEIAMIVSRYSLTPDRTMAIFFTEEVSKLDTRERA